LYDQLLETSKKVDFGSSLWKNQFELYKAGNVVSDVAIRDYLNTLADTRAEFSSVLAKNGQPTDSVRIAAEHAFPEKMSVAETQVAVDRSKKVAAAIKKGNESVLNRLINGESLASVAKAAEKTIDSKNQKESMTLTDEAKKSLKENFVTHFANGQNWTLKNGQAVQVQ
jgi:hypothetical protein